MKIQINHRILSAGLACGLLAAPALAAGPDGGTEWLVDCSARTLPSQARVGAMLGQDNAGQVYASRSRLMVEVNRACHRPGTSHVRLVLAPAPGQARLARRQRMDGEPVFAAK